MDKKGHVNLIALEMFPKHTLLESKVLGDTQFDYVRPHVQRTTLMSIQLSVPASTIKVYTQTPIPKVEVATTLFVINV